MGALNCLDQWTTRSAIAVIVLLSLVGVCAAAEVVPNRTVPKVRPAPPYPVFSDPPTDREITRARIFEEPLLATGPTTEADNRAVAETLTAYLAAGGGEHAGALESFVTAKPDSPWLPSLRLNLGLVYRRTGYWTRALEHWESAWAAGKTFTQRPTNAIGDRAAGELAQLAGRLGRYDRLEALFAEIDTLGRDIGGPAGEKLVGARQGLWIMHNRPEIGFLCGPLGIDRILSYKNPGYTQDLRLVAAESTMTGTSLLQNRDLSQDLGMGYQAAFRKTVKADVPTPALIHWKAGHFAALVDQRGGRYLLQDPTFGQEMWLSRAAIDDQASGYFLIPGGALPKGWRSVDDAESATIWGKGYTDANNHDNQKCGDRKSGGCGEFCPTNTCCGGRGMASYSFHTMLTALHIVDTPVGYSPPIGPSIDFQLGYHQREIFQPQTAFFSNFGPMWTFDWLSWVEDDPTDPAQPLAVYQRGGGREVFTGFDPGTGEYEPHKESRAVAVRVSADPIRYEVRWPNGSVDIYEQPDGAAAFPRKVLMTETIDPQGNAVELTWDGELRMLAVTDAIGQVTMLEYGLPSDPLKITKVTDPFGRFATFSYEDGRLVSITDVIGLTSSFDYGEGDFIDAMTTPYGTTTFAHFDQGRRFWIEATDPLGGTERLEYVNGSRDAVRGDEAQAVMPDALPGDEIPQGFSPGGLHPNLAYRNTFYWSKLAHARHPGDFSKAKMTHWLHQQGIWQTSGVIENEKEPLESMRTYYRYPNMPGLQTTGSHATPSGIGKVMDDGTDQIWRFEYNSAGKKIREIDPLGRETVFIFGTDNIPDADPEEGRGIDLLEIRQKNGENWDVLETRTYNEHHQPLSILDSGGALTTFSYNALGQIDGITGPPSAGHPIGPTTAFNYDTNGFLMSVVGPVPGVSTQFTYDAFGRQRTATGPGGLTRTFDYDALDRIVRVTYPDGTYEETVWNRLDPSKRRDRLGRWTDYYFDPLRRLTTIRDPMGNTTSYQWCGCGTIESIVDAEGNQTAWEYDSMGRVTAVKQADGSTTSYTYESATSRLSERSDRRGILTTFTYFLDDQIASQSFSDDTPAISYGYDPVTGLMTSATNGHDSLVWTYDAEGRLVSESSSHNSSQLGWIYDPAGRVTSLLLNGQPVSVYGFDQYARLESITRGADIFEFTYDAASRRRTLSYPNGVVTTVDYNDESRVQRLVSQQGESVLADHGYTYDLVGNVVSRSTLDWTEAYGYDNLNRLTSANRDTGERERWLYDGVGNRIVEHVGDSVTLSQYNEMNQLVSSGPGGFISVRGQVNEPATVTVSGQAATVDESGSFVGYAQVTEGANAFVVVARDANGNERTNVYSLDIEGESAIYDYDAEGNLTSAGGMTFIWDARNRLSETLDSEGVIESYRYDEIGRRIQRATTGNIENSIYANENIIRQDSTLNGVQNLIFGPHIDELLSVTFNGDFSAYYHSDIMGSIYVITDSTGGPTSARDYSVWGHPTSELSMSDHAFVGREFSAVTNFAYHRQRYYSPAEARFISEDPVRSLPMVKPHYPNEITPGIFVVGGQLESSDPIRRSPYVYAFNSPQTWVDSDGAGAVGDKFKWAKRWWKRLKCWYDREQCFKKIDKYCCEKHNPGKRKHLHSQYIACQGRYYVPCCEARNVKCHWVPDLVDEKTKDYTEDCPPGF